MEFPQYRKRFDEKAFYKITSLTTFEEIQLIGKRFFFHNVQAKKYFEQLQVRDMLEVSLPLYQMSSQDEYNHQLGNAREYMTSKQEK